MKAIDERPMTGKTILIIGATAGIGRASAAQLAHQGAHVTITGRDPDKTARIPPQRSAPGSATSTSIT